MQPSARREWNPWAAGLTIFAGVLMITVGVFQAFQGLVALFDDEFYLTVRDYTFKFDITAWGWIHLIGGALVAVTGYFVVRGALWARVVAMVLAGFSALANFAWIPYYPLWSILIVALDILIIWALAIYQPTRT
jgi:hypothetical protein